MRANLVTSPQGTLLLRGVQVGADRSVMVNALELTRSSFGELVGTDVETAMMNANSSAFIRVPFSVPNLAAVDQLLLEMQYDAGFVAYLNGQEVARRNAPTAAGVPPAFNAAATTERSNSEALTAETIDLTQFKNLLSQGSNNVLAIHGLNSAAGDEDFLIAPKLRALSVGGSALRYFETPTPGAANTSGVIDFVSAVQPSAAHGFYNAPFSVTLATPTAGTSIYYTFDGSVPAPSNPKAMLYAAPFMVTTTTVLRSAALRDRLGRFARSRRRLTSFSMTSSAKPSIRPIRPAIRSACRIRESGKPTLRAITTWTRKSLPSGTTTTRPIRTSEFAKH